MAKSGLKHIDVGPDLSKTEWESEDSHELIHGNSFPGSPVERQLFYRDDEHKWYIYDGSAWVWLGGGSGGGMEVHGNEYHDPDFEQQGVAATLIATHAGLTTGIHGVGANHIPQAPAAAHLVRTFTKGWTSGYFLTGAGVNTNPTEVYLPEFTKVWFHEQWTNNPEVAGTIWAVAFVGSGDIPYWTAGRLALSTLATINSFVRVSTSAAGLFAFSPGQQAFWATQWADTDRTNSTVLLGIWINTAGIPPSLTAHHAGFKVLEGAIYATNADGTTEKATNTGITYASQWGLHNLLFVVSSGAINYYVDGVVKATHTENLPTMAAGFIYNSITNTVAANRSIEIKVINARGAD